MTHKTLGLLTLLAATSQLTAQPITVISSDEQRFDFHTEFLPEQFARQVPQMNKHNAEELTLENVHSEVMPTLLELFRRHKLTLKNRNEDLNKILTPVLDEVADINQAFELLGLVDGFNLRDEFSYAVAFRITELAGDAELEFPEDGSLRSELQRMIQICTPIVQKDWDYFKQHPLEKDIMNILQHIHPGMPDALALIAYIEQYDKPTEEQKQQALSGIQQTIEWVTNPEMSPEDFVIFLDKQSAIYKAILEFAAIKITTLNQALMLIVALDELQAPIEYIFAIAHHITRLTDSAYIELPDNIGLKQQHKRIISLYSRMFTNRSHAKEVDFELPIEEFETALGLSLIETASEKEKGWAVVAQHVWDPTCRPHLEELIENGNQSARIWLARSYMGDFNVTDRRASLRKAEELLLPIQDIPLAQEELTQIRNSIAGLNRQQN